MIKIYVTGIPSSSQDLVSVSAPEKVPLTKFLSPYKTAIFKYKPIQTSCLFHTGHTDFGFVDI